MANRSYILLYAPLVLTGILLGFSTAGAATNAGITYQGRLLDPSGVPVTGSVQFKIQIRTPNASDCLMYQETKSTTLNSDGDFVLTVNDGTGTLLTGSLPLDQVFANRGTLTFTHPNLTCGGTNTFSPDPADGRKVVVSFNDGSGWEALPSMDVNFVPSAIESMQVGGYGSGDLLRVDRNDPANQTVDALTFVEYGKLVDLINGVGTTINSGTIGGSTAINTTGNVTAGNVSSSLGAFKSVEIWKADNSHKVTLSVQPTLNADYTLALPLNDGDPGQILSTDGSGTLSWVNDGGGGGGGATSVGLTMPNIFSVTNSPVTTTGSLTASLVVQNANKVFAGPTSGGDAVPAFRTLVSDDIPSLNASKITAGQLAVAQGGTGRSTVAANGLLYASALDTIGQVTNPTNNSVLLSTGAVPGWSTGTNNTFLKGSTAGNVTWSAVDLATADVTGTLPVTRGGTGAATLAADKMYVGNVSGTGLITFTCAQYKILSFDASGNPTCADQNASASSGSSSGVFAMNSNSDASGSDGGFSFQANTTPLMTISNAGVVDITATTASTSSATGALTVDGGLGVAGAAHIGTTLAAGTSMTTPIIYGSTAASGTLTLHSTSDATKGHVLINPSGGRVGIGTTSPSNQLHVSAADSDTTIRIANRSSTAARYPALKFENFTGTFGGTPQIQFFASRGSEASPAAVSSGDGLGAIEMYGGKDTSGTWAGGASITSRAEENFAAGTAASNLSFWTTPSGSTSQAERMRITGSGNVGIGTDTPVAGTRLDITGTGAGASSIIIPRDTVANRPTVGVNGMMRYASDTNKFEVFENGGWVNVIGGSAAGSGSATGAFTVNSNSDASGSDGGFNFQANGSSLMTISNAGLVDITATTASTSSTTGALTVDGGLGVAGAINVGTTLSAGTSMTTPIIYGSAAASGTLTLHSTSDATKGHVLINPSGGYVGIGTTSPGSTLDVRRNFTVAPWSQLANMQSVVSGASASYNGTIGLYTDMENQVTGAGWSDVVGYQAEMRTANDAGDSQAVIGYQANMTTHSGDTGYGVYVRSSSSGNSTGGTQYGLYLALDDADVSNRYGIYQSSANNNYFAGSVGIGTDGPAYKVDVHSGTTGAIRAMTTNDTPFALAINNANFGTTDAKAFSLWQANDGSAMFNVNGSERLMIDSSGNTVVGEDWVEAVHATAGLFAGVTPKLQVMTGSSTGTYEELMTLRHWQKDGTAVTRRLGLVLKLSNDGSAGESNKMGGIVVESDEAWSNNPSLHLVTGNAKRMTIDIDGNVGIGTTAPSQLLEVNGNVRIGSQTTRTTSSSRGQLALGSTYVVTVNANTSVDWDKGNIQELNTFACNGTKTITMTNLRDGAAYTLLLSGSAAHSGLCLFSAGGYTFKTSGGNASPVASKDVLFSFAVINNIVVYTMMDDLQ